MKRFPFKKVNNILENASNKYRRINWGGCGFMAAIIAQHLAPIVDDINIVCYSGWSANTNIDAVRSQVKINSMDGWEGVGVGFGHVWVEFKWKNKWYAIDCEGIISRALMRHKWGNPGGGSFTLKEIKAISNNRSGWNDSFNRDQVPSMRNHIGRKFNNLFVY